MKKEEEEITVTTVQVKRLLSQFQHFTDPVCYMLYTYCPLEINKHCWPFTTK